MQYVGIIPVTEFLWSLLQPSGLDLGNMKEETGDLADNLFQCFT